MLRFVLCLALGLLTLFCILIAVVRWGVAAEERREADDRMMDDDTSHLLFPDLEAPPHDDC